jgi:tape measure domain-containing protein
MSGVEIDVSTNRAESAKRDLRELNNHLAALVKNSKLTGSAFNGVKTDNFKNLSKDLATSTRAMVDFKGVGTNSMGAVDKSAEKLTSTIGSLKTMLVSAGGAFLAFKGASAFNQMADDLTLVQNKLKLVAETSEDVLRLQQQLYKSAKDTRSGLAGTADLFVTFTQAMERAGSSQDKVLKVVSTIQRAAALSGSSVESTNAAITQLTQGIASGVTRGEEFNSVVEQMKYLGTGLQRVLNKNAGELRAFANQGGLSTEVLLDALSNMSERTERDFAKTTATVTQAAAAMRNALAYSIGDFNKYFGFSDRFSRRLLKVSGGIDNFSKDMVASIVILKESIRNYIRQFDLFDAAELTIKAALKMEISPLDAYDKYQQYKAIKAGILSVEKFLGTKKDLQVRLEKPDVDASGLARFKIDPKAAEDTRTFKELLTEIGKAGLEVTNFILIAFENVAKLLPVIRGPVQTVGSSLREFAKNTMADFNALTYDAVMPFNRALESIIEPLSAFTAGDTALERKWVDLFKSDSIVDFTERLKELNAVRSRKKYDDEEFISKEIGRSLRTITNPIQDFLISLNILDNRLLKVSSTSDRVAVYFRNIGRVLTRLYKDVLATTLEPIFAKLSNKVIAFGETLGDVFSDVFNESTGKKFGTLITSGIIGALKGLVKFAKSFGSKGLLDNIFGKSIGEKALSLVRNAVKGVSDFIRGFFKGAFESAADELSPNIFKKALRNIKGVFSREFDLSNSFIAKRAQGMLGALSDFKFRYVFDFDKSAFDKGLYYLVNMLDEMLKISVKMLAKVEMRIRKFGQNIKDIFFDIYDAVVGHSYWPDMVDGVVNYTDKLFDASPALNKFSSIVKSVFSKLYADVSSMGGNLGSALKETIATLKNVDWGKALNTVTASIGGVILAGMALAFGNTQMKISAVSFFLGLFNDAVEGALSSLAPVIGSALGSSLQIATSHFVSGLVNTLDAYIASAPKLFSGFVESFAPFTGVITDIMKNIPILSNLISNSLFPALVIAGGAFAAFRKGGFETISEFLVGSAGSKKKPAKEGAFSYLGALLGKSNIKTESLVDTLFKRKDLAIAAAGAFSLALLDSVSLIDAATFGIPLLSFALLGRDGGAKLTRDAISFVIKTLSNSYKAGAAAVAGQLGSQNLLSKALQFPIDFFSKSGSTVKSGVRLAGEQVFTEVKSMIGNLRSNTEAYAAGKLSLSEALFSGKRQVDGPYGKVTKTVITDLKGSIKNLGKELSGLTFDGKSLKSYFDSFSEAMKKGSASVVSRYKSIDLLGPLSTAAASLFTKIRQIVTSSYSLMADGVSLIGSLIKNKLFLFSILVAGFSATAFAASDASTAITATASSLSTIGGTLTLVAAGLAGLGLAFRSMKAYKTGVELFEAALIPASDAKAYGKNRYSMESEGLKAIKSASEDRAKVFKKRAADELAQLLKSQTEQIEAQKPPAARKAILQQIAKVERDSLKRKLNENFDSSERQTTSKAQAALYAALSAKDAEFKGGYSKGQEKNARNAGFGAVRVEIVRSLESAKDGLLKLKAAGLSLAASPAMIVSWWSEKIKAMSKYAKATIATQAAVDAASLASKSFSEGLELLKRKQLGSAISLIAASIGTLGKASLSVGGTVLKDSLLSLKDVLIGPGGLKKAFEVTRKGLTSMLDSPAIKKSASAIASAIWSVGKIPLMVAGGVGVAGALGLWMFGPNNSFIENLEWAYDKMRAMLGLTPSTATGKANAISANLTTRKIGPYTSDFSADLARVDYSKLSDTQVKVLTELSATTKEGLDNLQTEFERLGYLTEQQVAEAKRREAETRGVLLRQPSLPKMSLKQSTDALVTELNAVDTSMWQLFKSFVGYTPTLSGMTVAATAWQKAMTSLSGMFDTMLGYLTGWPAMILGAIGGVLGLSGGIVGSVVGTIVGALAGAMVSMIGDFVVYIAKGIGSIISKAAVATGEATKSFGRSFAEFFGLSDKFVMGFESFIDAIIDLGLGRTQLSVIGDAIKSIFEGWVLIGAEVSETWEGLKKSLGLGPSAKDAAEGRKISTGAQKAIKFDAFLPAEIRETLLKANANYSAAASDETRLRRRGFRPSDAETGVKYTQADFDKKLAAAVSTRDGALKNLLFYQKQAGNIAERLFDRAELDKDLTKLSSSAKELLNADIGKAGEKFLGTRDQLGKLRIEAVRAQQGRDFAKQASSFEERNKFLYKEESAKRRAAGVLEEAGAKTGFETAIAYNVKVSGVDAAIEDIRRMALSYSESYKEFDKYAEEINRLQVEINEAASSSTPEIISKLYSQLSAAKLKAIQASFTTTDFNQLNKRLQTAGLEAISGAQFAGISEKEIKTIAAGVDKIRLAQENLNALSVSGKPFEAQIVAMRELQGLVAKTKLDLAIAATTQLQNLQGSPAERAAKLAQVTGQETPLVIAASTSKLDKYTSAKIRQKTLETEQLKLQDQLNRGITMGAGQYSKNAAELVRIDKTLTKLNETYVITLDNVLSMANAFGGQLDALSFSGLGVAAQKELAKVGESLAAIDRDLGEKSASSLAGGYLEGLLKRQSDLVARAQAALLTQTKFSGKQLGQLFADVGVESVSRLGTESVKLIIQAYKQVQSLKAIDLKLVDTNDEASLKGFLDNLKAQEKLSKNLKRIAEAASATIKTSASDFNEVFGTALTDLDFTRFSGKLAASFGASAKVLKDGLEDAYSSGGTAVTRMLEKFDELKRAGVLISFVASFENALRDTTFEGVKTGFDRVQSILPDLSLSVFGELAPEQRRAFSKQAMQLEELNKAMSLPGLSEELADILNTFTGTNVDEVLQKFNEQIKQEANTSLSEARKTSQERLVGALETLDSSVRGLSAVILKTPSTLPGNFVEMSAANPEAPKVGAVSSEAIKALVNAPLSQRLSLFDKAPTARGKLTTAGTGVTDSVFDTATEAQRQRLLSLTRGKLAKEDEYAKAGEDQKPAIRQSISAFEYQLDYLISSINEKSVYIRDAGKAFSESLVGGLTDSLKELLKGKAEEGKSMWTSFRDSVLSVFTTTVIDTSVESLMASVAGKDGLLQRGLNSIGSGIAGMFSSSDKPGEGGEGIIASIVSFGTTLLAPLLSMLGIQTAAVATDSVAVVTEQAMLIALTVQIPAAIAASTAAIVAALSVGEATEGFANFAAVFAATGGYISGSGTGTSDSIPAMLSNGEFVVNAKATKRFGSLLSTINGGNIPRFAEGGIVPTGIIATPSQVDVSKSQNSRNTSQQIINLTITGDISRQTKSEIYRMLPSIAEGVNSHNREKGYR